MTQLLIQSYQLSSFFQDREPEKVILFVKRLIRFGVEGNSVLGKRLILIADDILKMEVGAQFDVSTTRANRFTTRANSLEIGHLVLMLI